MSWYVYEIIYEYSKGPKMKLYNFKICLYASGFFCIFASIFVYGLIWLNNGYNVEESEGKLRKEIQELRTEQEFWINAERLNSQLVTDLIYKPKWKDEIMPSCLRGRK